MERHRSSVLRRKGKKNVLILEEFSGILFLDKKSKTEILRTDFAFFVRLINPPTLPQPHFHRPSPHTPLTTLRPPPPANRPQWRKLSGGSEPCHIAMFTALKVMHGVHKLTGCYWPHVSANCKVGTASFLWKPCTIGCHY